MQLLFRRWQRVRCVVVLQPAGLVSPAEVAAVHEVHNAVRQQRTVLSAGPEQLLRLLALLGGGGGGSG